MTTNGLSRNSSDLVQFFDLMSDQSSTTVPAKILKKTAECIANHSKSGDTLKKQFTFLKQIVKSEFIPDDSAETPTSLIRKSTKVHAFVQNFCTNKALILPKYPSASSVHELTALIQKRGASADGSLSSIDEKTLIETAQIVAIHPHSGETAIDQYNWLCDLAWEHKGKAEDRGPFWGEHLVQNDVGIHDYADRYLRPGLTVTDTDDVIREFLGVKSKPTEIARRLLPQLEAVEGMKEILYDLTGNAPCHTEAQKISHLLSLLKEVGLESAVKGPPSERLSLDAVVTRLQEFHKEALDHARIQLARALPEEVRAALFGDLATHETPHAKAEYIKRQFDTASGSAFRYTHTLLLHNQNIRILPPEIGKLSALVNLALHDNKLTSLPGKFTRLRALEALVLSNNKITSFPDKLTRFTKLEYLDLNNNIISSLPGSVKDLTTLMYLLINHNKLTSLPDKLGNLTKLKELDLNNNKLTSLPVPLQRLSLSPYSPPLPDLPFEGEVPGFRFGSCTIC